MTRLAAIAGVAGALALQGCAGSGMQFYDYPRQPDATATIDECEGMALALKATPAFAEAGPFSLDVHTGYDSSTTPPSETVLLSQRLVMDAFHELAPSTASELGSTLANRQAGQFRAHCSWDRWGIAFETPHNPEVIGHVELPPPAASADGRWLLVTGEVYVELAPDPKDTDSLSKLDEFACLLERSTTGWTLKRCAPTSLQRPIPKAPAAL